MVSPEQNKIFDAYDFMFATEGWKMFMDEVKKNQESIFPALMSNKVTIEDVYFLKGRNDVYLHVLGLQNLLENIKKNIEESQDNESDSV